MNVNATGFKSLDRLGQDPRVREIYKDSDGLWLTTRAGFCTDPECHTAHGENVRDLLLMVKGIAPCACADCVEETR